MHDRYLGPSLAGLQGEFEVISTSDADFPAANYNTLLARCETEFLVLTHQDVSFPPDLLERMERTLALLPDCGALGMVGRDRSGNYRWSSPEQVYEVDTLDCCYLVIRRDTAARFDTLNFGEYHLYVEDFCAQITRLRGQKVYTMLIASGEQFDSLYTPDYRPLKLVHHSATVSQKGFRWGRYDEFRATLARKWGDVQTT